MSHRSRASRRTEGFVLIYTLWLLLAGTVLLATTSGIALNRAREASAQIRWMRSTAAAESAAHEVMYALIKDGRQALSRLASSERVIDDIRLRIAITSSDGLVAVNTAEATVLRKAFIAALGGDGAALVDTVRRNGRIGNYDQLAAIEGLPAGGNTCLLEYVTLASSRTKPSAGLAPARVKSALGSDLGEREADSTAVSTPASLAGESFRIDVTATSANVPTRHLFAEVLITGRIDRPVHLLDWRWLPVESSDPSSRHCAS